MDKLDRDILKLIEILKGFGPPEPELAEEPHPLLDSLDRRDVYLCYPCTMKLSVPWNIRHSFHRYDEKCNDEKDEYDHPHLYGDNVTVGQQLEIYEWENAMSEATSDTVRPFISRRQRETSMLEVRDKSVIAPMSILTLREKSLWPTFDEISKRTDICDYAMFPEEIEEWAIGNRAKFPISDAILDIEHEPWGYTLRESFAQFEFPMFAIYLQEQKLGAGSQFFCGRLVDTDRIKNLTEEKIEAYWNQLGF